jgi:hypothetical protein
MEVSSYLTDKRTLDGFDINSKSFFNSLLWGLYPSPARTHGHKSKVLNIKVIPSGSIFKSAGFFPMPQSTGAVTLAQ